jgi:hypothetical protein
MSNFSKDSDLLAHEPMIFHELPFAGQTRLRVTDAAISGQTVTSPSGGFAALAPGHVAIVGDGAFAIAAIVNDNTLTLAVPPVGVGGSTLVVRTFAPQAAVVHDELLRALGIDPDHPGAAASESKIVSRSWMTQLEALGTLSRAYAAAVSIGADNRRILEKAERYRQRFSRGLIGAAVLLDLDGDGRPDTVRHPGIVTLTRE